MGLELLKSGVSGIITPQAMHFAWVPFLILLFSIAVKGALFFFYRDAGRLIDADSLKAASAIPSPTCWRPPPSRYRWSSGSSRRFRSMA